MGLFKKKKKMNLSDFQNLFQMYLLFDKKPNIPSSDQIIKELTKKFGEVSSITGQNDLKTFAIKKFNVKFKDATLPAQVMMGLISPFEEDKISFIEKSQFWDIKDSDKLLGKCKYQLLLSDFMSSILDYKERCELLIGWLETATILFPDCIAVWIPSAGKLLTPEQIINNPANDNNKFVYVGVNARYFNIKDTEDMVVDTVGLNSIGLPDIQCHFHSIEPNHVVNYVYNIASYIFNNSAPIKSGETIDGIGNDGQISRDIRWKCHYEMSLIEPERELMDVCPGEYASGNRDNYI